jgi:hypothetical protein
MTTFREIQLADSFMLTIPFQRVLLTDPGELSRLTTTAAEGKCIAKSRRCKTVVARDLTALDCRISCLDEQH